MDPRDVAPSPGHGTIMRSRGRNGELVLRLRDGHYEIISNGMFLMDTRDGRSERLLVRAALEATAGHDGEGREHRVLIAGLGVGSSLAEALRSPVVDDIVVIEVEPAIVAWNRACTGARTGGRVDDPRVRCVVDDLGSWLRRPQTERFDVVCLDVDNGPTWTVTPGNDWLYGDEGLGALHDRLRDGGALSVWSAAPAPAFERTLARRFGSIQRLEVPVARGEPDMVYVAVRS